MPAHRPGGKTANPPPIDAASLNDAALGYLARYAATEAGLRRVLRRRLDRWLQAQPDREAAAPALATAEQSIDALVGKLVRLGAVSDAAFAEARARSLTRSGRSRRAVQASLVAKGVTPEIARQAAAQDGDAELAAALVLARKRRLGPYRAAEPGDPLAAQRRELGILARAGFARDAAERALRMDHEEAEQRIRALRSGQDAAAVPARPLDDED